MPEETTQQATLINPEIPIGEDGRRVPVNLDDQDTIQGHFGSGYFLETGYDEATGESTWDTGNPPDPAPEAEAPEQGYQMGRTANDNYGGRFSHIQDENRRAYMEQQYKEAGEPQGAWSPDMNNYDPNQNYKGTQEETEQTQIEQDYEALREENILLQEQINQNLDDFSTTTDENSKALIASIKAKYDIKRIYCCWY